MLKTKIEELKEEYKQKIKVERIWMFAGEALLLTFLIMAIIFGTKLKDFTYVHYDLHHSNIKELSIIGGGLFNYFYFIIIWVPAFIIFFSVLNLPKTQLRTKGLLGTSVATFILALISLYVLYGELPDRINKIYLNDITIASAKKENKEYLPNLHKAATSLQALRDLYMYFTISIAVGLTSFIPFAISYKCGKKLELLQRQITIASGFENELEMKRVQNKEANY